MIKIEYGKMVGDSPGAEFRDIKISEISGEFNKKVTMCLVGLDGNAFNLMGQFSKRARGEGWTKHEIDYVIKQCMSSDYNHLLRVLMKYTKEDKDNPYHNGEAYRKI